tara:strand:- start:980 stop:1906 length:927 start_codon:yes stop_codon:yes gene_type:complete
MPKRDYEQELTQHLIAELESGCPPWERGWLVLGRHYNIDSGNEYSGNNQFILPLIASSQSFDSNQWGTYKNWSDASAQHNKALGQIGENTEWYGVKSGETSSMVFFWNTKEVPDKDQPKQADGTYPLKRIFWKKWWAVFNRDQTGLPPLEYDHPDIPITESEEAMLSVIYKYCEDNDITIKRGGDSAFYSPSRNLINMPKDSRFTSVEERMNTWAHEVIHSTGPHFKRKMGVFGDREYAQEELIAEMGAALICAQFGVDYTSRNNLTAYIGGWLKALKGDKNYIVKVSGDTGKAVRRVMEYAQSEEEE